MKVTITVNNIWSRLSGLKNVELADMLDKKMSYYVEGYRFTRAFTQGYRDKDGQWRHWDGKRHLLTQRMVFPTGLLDRVRGFLKFHKVTFTIDDRRERPLGEPLSIKGYKPRPYQQEAADAAFNSGCGIIRIGTGGGKSPRIGTLVLKYDGTVCKAEDLKAGDLLMGPDSRSRKVLSVNIRYGNICRIQPKRGDAWYCNDEHILTLKHANTNEVVDISIPDYIKQHDEFKHYYKQFSVGVDFPQPESLPIDPYFLGLWFGNQTGNPLGREIKKFLNTDLEVPSSYLTSSKRDRLDFLAGWIDSDGHLYNNCYEIIQKRKDWTDSIAFLARSLGFKVVVTKKYNERHYNKIEISGHVCEIPVRIARKKALSQPQKDPCKTGFSIEPAGKDFYVGIELDGDGRFLLGDFTVTHNTLVAAMMIARHNVPSMIYVIGKDLLYQFHEELVKTLGPKEVGLIGDGHCDVRRFNVCSIWTAVTAFGLKSKTVSLDDEDWQPEVFDLNAAKKGEIKRAVTESRLAVFDEAHFIACDTIQSIFKASKQCRYMFGLTGTDWRDDGADLLLESVCGQRIYNAKSSTLIKQGYLVPPKIVMLEMPKNPDITKKMSWSEVYSRYITNNNDRNEVVVKAAKQLVGMGRKVLILVRYLKHGKNLVDMMGDVSVFFVSGELDGETRRDVKKRFEAGELQCLIASSVFDIGVDIPCLDALVLAGGGKSTVRALQRIGRVIRQGSEEKTDALVVDFIDNAKYLDKHSATRIAVYETEPCFQIKFPEGFDRGSLKKIRKVKAKIR